MIYVIKYIINYIIIFAGIIFIFGFANHADAAIIVQAPKYVGLNSGLAAFWSFDGKSTDRNLAVSLPSCNI